ncbi:hypothetical protein [Aureibaculum luteum]|uniref:hypothetical protein n=1 Tax=Aureibaculum luteum TaxID=1548456 RepID=UPI000E4BB274|nr:hypothetical protein [Aureibaculum luteum]
MASLLNKKLKAGALQYTIFIAVVIALLVFAFISLSFVQNKLRIKATFFQEVVTASNQSFNRITNIELPYNQKIIVPKDEDTYVETTLLKKHWGVYDVLSVTSTRDNEIFSRTALLGGQEKKRTALYLEDANQPLVVVGDTRIMGKSYLPIKGVKRGSIGGKSYMGNQLIYGQVLKSSKKLPEFQNSIKYNEVINRTVLNENNETIELDENLRLVHSFSEPTKIIREYGTITLNYQKLSGNIVMYSETKIKVKSISSLKDVILIAPEIEIEDNVIGNFQAFANKKITIGKNCVLNYPSALILDEKIVQLVNKNEQAPQILIDKESQIKGMVVFISRNETDNYKPQIVIEEQSTVMGEVYCSKNMELLGMVKGSVYTKGFIASQFGSVYKNHIYNGKIIAIDLPKQYCGLTFKNSKLEVAQWLNY